MVEANQKAVAEAELDIKMKVRAALESAETAEQLAKEAEQEAQMLE